MNTQGVETLKAAARRSLWLILVLVALGILVMNLIRQSQGPLYEAQSKVVLSPTDLSQLFSGSSAYVDPQLVDQTESALANAPGLFARAAGPNGQLGSGPALQSATSVSKSGSTISFTTTASTPGRAVAIASAVARAYPQWRAHIASAAVEKAITQIQGQLRLGGGTRPDLVAQLNRLQVLKTLTSGNVLLVESADRATQTRPRPVRDSLIGAFIGLFAALVVAALREAADTRVRSEEEIEEVLAVPVIGSVELLPRRTTLVPMGPVGERYSDMYGLLAANIGQEANTKPTVIAVTSATASEGKTTTASNVAAALARRNANVLLIDMDTRKPAVAKAFGIPNEAPGLEQALRRGRGVDGLAWKISLNGAADPKPRPPQAAGVPVPGAVKNGKRSHGSLDVLPLGASIKGGIGAHLDGVKRVLEGVGDRYDYLIIDTPPALALPDVTELTKLLDGVIVVVRHGRATRRSLTALNRLHRSWPNIRKGAVLVGVPRQQTYSYYEQ